MFFEDFDFNFNLTMVFGMFIATSIGYISMLIMAWLLTWRKEISAPGSNRHFFTLIICCRNEELVIKNTLTNLNKLDYPSDQLEILVVNDGCADNTVGKVTELEYQEDFRNTNVSILNINTGIAGQGKAVALNRAIRTLPQTSRFYRKKDWIIGVFDADGRPHINLLKCVSKKFDNPKIGAINSAIRINNRGTSLLARMQDIEFHVVTRIINKLRSDLFERAYMGGNGQFMRFKSLKKLGKHPWSRDSMTEDLDIGLRIATTQGWRMVQLDNYHVEQQGVVTLGTLYRQRVRWSWGTFQVMHKYLFSTKLWGSWYLNILNKIDITTTLINPLFSAILIPFTFISMGLYLGDKIGIQLPVSIESAWAIPSSWILIILILMFFVEEYRSWKTPFFFFIYIFYVFFQLIPIFVGFYRYMCCKRPRWAKTKRNIETET